MGFQCPFLLRSEGTGFRLFYRGPGPGLGLEAFEARAARWPSRCDGFSRSSECSGHADGLVGWPHGPVPTACVRCAGLRDGHASYQLAPMRTDQARAVSPSCLQQKLRAQAPSTSRDPRKSGCLARGPNIHDSSDSGSRACLCCAWPCSPAKPTSALRSTACNATGMS